MIAVNLLPMAHRIAAARRRRLRRWCAAGAVYAVVLAGILGGAVLPGRAGGIVLDAQIREVAAQADRAGGGATAARAELEAVQSQVRAVRRITGHPDWSIMLGVVARACEGQIVLELCELEPVAPKAIVKPASNPAGAPAAPAAPPSDVGEYVLRLNGIGRRQQEVPRFVLRLEEMHLFERVVLVESQSRTLGDAGVFGFRIECALRDSGGPTP